MLASGKRVSKGEMAILRFVMDHQPVTTREVGESVDELKNAARSMAHTMLERLRAKGHLVRSTEHGVILYSLARDKAEMEKWLFADFFETALGGSVSPVVAFLSDRGSLTQKEAAELREFLQNAEIEGEK